MPQLDEVDEQILAVLSVEGRIPNNALAARAGVAPSTCLTRVRALQERGIIRGFAADIDPSALGYPIQAMVAVSVQAHARAQLSAFMDAVLELPGVMNAYLLGGSSDFLIHVAATSVDSLRRLVIDELSRDPIVASTETSLIFKYARASRVPVSR